MICTNINDFQLSKDLYEILSDMIVGVLGVSYCTIAITVNRKLIVMASSSSYKIGSELDTLNVVENCIVEYITKNNEIIGAIKVRMTKGGTTPRYTKQFLKLICAQLLLILDNRSLNEKMLLQANTDLLTGCYNRRSFYDLIKTRLIYENNYCVLMFDIDKFKLINDKYGHEAGDIVLKTLGELLLTSTRKDDIVCRYGGEEFVVYLHGVCSKTVSFIKADAIRQLVESSVVIADKVKIKFTISVGAAVTTDEISDIQSVIKIADTNLYKSKNTGRNKITI